MASGLSTGSRNKKKFLKKPFLANNQSSIVQKLCYNNKFLSKNKAHGPNYKDILQHSHVVPDDVIDQLSHDLYNELNKNIDFNIYTSKSVKNGINPTNSTG